MVLISLVPVLTPLYLYVSTLLLLLLLLLIIIIMAIELSLGDSSPYTRTDKTDKNKCT